MNCIVVDTDKIKSVLLKNFTEIKNNLDSVKSDLSKMSSLFNSSIKNDFDYLFREVSDQLSLTNEYYTKLEGIIKDFDLLSDNYNKKITSIEKINGSSLNNI